MRKKASAKPYVLETGSWEEEAWEETHLFGCGGNMSPLAFVQMIERCFGWAFTYQSVCFEKALPSPSSVSTPQLTLWLEEEKSSIERYVYYTFTQAEESISHYIYPKRFDFFKSAGIREYDAMRYWWLIQGNLHKADTFCESLRTTLCREPSVYFFERIALAKMVEIPPFLFDPSFKNATHKQR